MTEPNNNDTKTPEIKLNMKEKAFCSLMTAIETETWSNRALSAEKAGYTKEHCYRQGTKLLSKSYIVTKIKQLIDETFRKMGWDRETCLMEYAHDRTMARENNQYSTAKDITTKIGEIGGFFKQRVEVESLSQTDIPKRLEDMLPTERLKFVAEQRAIDIACKAYKLAMNNAGIPIERGREISGKQVG